MFVLPALQSFNSRYYALSLVNNFYLFIKKLNDHQIDEKTNEMELKLTRRINSKRMHLKT